MRFLILIIFSLVVLSSCAEVKIVYTINDDYTTRIDFDVNSAVDPMGMSKDINAEYKALEDLANLIRMYKSAKNWSNFSYMLSPDSSTLNIQVTAFLDDFRNFQNPNFPYSFYKKDDDLYFGIGGNLDSLNKLVDEMMEGVDLSVKTNDSTLTEYKESLMQGLDLIGFIVEKLNLNTKYVIAGNLIEEDTNENLEFNTVNLNMNGELIYFTLKHIFEDPEVWKVLAYFYNDINMDDSPLNNPIIAKKFLELLPVKFGAKEVKVEMKSRIFDYEKSIEKSSKEWKELEKVVQPYLEKMK